MLNLFLRDPRKDQIFRDRLIGPIHYNDIDLLEFLRKRYINKPPNNPKITKTRISDNISWKFIHSTLKNFFHNKSNGFYVEAGALDGEYFSNTLFLENSLNWTGLLVEPHPYSYDVLISRKRNAWTSNACLSSNGYPFKAVLGTHFPMGEINIIKKDIVNGYRSTGGIVEDWDTSKFTAFYPVQCFPLASFLLAIKKPVVDLIIIDIEGGEPGVIETFPWNDIMAHVWIIEHKYGNNNIFSVHKEFVNMFESHNYTLIGNLEPPVEYVFVHNSSPILETARTLNAEKLRNEIKY